MRRLIALLVAVFVVATAAACNNNAGSSDPYELLRRAGTATQDQVQIDIGGSAKSGTTTVTLDSGAIRIVMDETAGKGTFHLSLPTASLGIDAATLTQLGVTGSTIDFDALWDGQALYAKSPVLAALLKAFAGQLGITLPSGDLAGWLKLLTKADIDTLGAGASAAPVAPVETMADAAAMKKALNDVGITLTLAGTESKNNVNANHITGTIDSAKLLASPMFDSLSRTQLGQVEDALKKATLTFDMWLDSSSNRMVELDIHMVSTEASAESIDVTVGFSTPSSPSFDTPANAVEIPTMEIVGKLIQMFGASLAG